MAYNSLVNLPSEEDIIECHKIFCNTFVFVFMNKLRKYGNLIQDCAYIDTMKKDAVGDLNNPDDMDSLLRSCVREYNDCQFDSHLAANNLHVDHNGHGLNSGSKTSENIGKSFVLSPTSSHLSDERTPGTKQNETPGREINESHKPRVNGLYGKLTNCDCDDTNEQENQNEANVDLFSTSSPRRQFKRNSSIRRIKGMVKKYTAVSKVFQWVYKLVKLKRAKKIIPKLRGMSELEVKIVIQATALEVFVAYQYQIGMLDGDNEIIILAKHAVLCCTTYLSYSDAEFNSGKLSEAVIDIFPKHSSNSTKFVRTKFTDSEFNYRWKLDCIFKCPGLRIKSSLLDVANFDNTKTNQPGAAESQNNDPLSHDDVLRSENITKSQGVSSFDDKTGSETFWSASKGVSASEWMKQNFEKSNDSPYSKMEESCDSVDFESACDQGDGLLVADLCCIPPANEEGKLEISEDGQRPSQMYVFYGCFTPYGHACDYNVYGFRGPLHIRRSNEVSYTMVDRDIVTCQSQRSRRAKLEDSTVHQFYIPYFSCNHKLELVNGGESR